MINTVYGCVNAEKFYVLLFDNSLLAQIFYFLYININSRSARIPAPAIASYDAIECM